MRVYRRLYRRYLVSIVALLMVLIAAQCGSGSDNNSNGGDSNADMADPPCSCTTGEKRCQGTQIQVCEMMTGTCSSWGPGVACASGMCTAGSCGGACQDSCSAGVARCSGDTHREICRVGSSGCLEWVTESCPGQQYCNQNQCVDSLPCDVGCPSGYTCQKNGVCAGGIPTGLVLNVPTVQISGAITLNGATPTNTTAECSTTVNPTVNKSAVKFVETTKGYTFYGYSSCKDSTFSFSQSVYPGTYQVSVLGQQDPYYPYGPLTNLPQQAFVVDPGLVISADTAGKVFNVKTVQVSGAVTLNGATPTNTTAECSTTVNPTVNKSAVKFVENTHGYTFYGYSYCKDSTFSFSQSVYPGTYQVSVLGQQDPYYPYGPLTNLPQQAFVVDPALVISADISGKVLNVKTVQVSGAVTLNGATPVNTAAECSTTVNPTVNKSAVKFVENSHGYTFYGYSLCKDSSYTFSQSIYPGTYQVSVLGQQDPYYPYGPLSNLPQQAFVVDPALVVSADLNGKTFNVKTVQISGGVTLNGATPTNTTAECSPTVNPTVNKSAVKFIETSYGYTFYGYSYCKDSTYTFAQSVYPGTYQVSVLGQQDPYYPYGALTNLPQQAFVVDPALVISADTAGKVFNVKTLQVSGAITLNGATPLNTDAECSTTVNPTVNKSAVKFVETTHFYTFYGYSYCKDSSYSFAQSVYPGTYQVSVLGQQDPYYPYGPLTNLPQQAFVVNPALVISADLSGQVFNVKTYQVAGSVTLNGARPMNTAAECSTTVNPTVNKSAVKFVETTQGYTFYGYSLCKDSTFTFSSSVYPGTYELSVLGQQDPYYPYGPLTNLPQQGYVAVSRLQIP